MVRFKLLIRIPIGDFFKHVRHDDGRDTFEVIERILVELDLK